MTRCTSPSGVVRPRRVESARGARQVFSPGGALANASTPKRSALVSSSLRRSAAFLLVVAFLGAPASLARAGYDGPGDFSAAEVQDHWFAAWAGPAQDTSTSATPRVFAPDTTIREPGWLTLGGSRLRVKLSNAMGAAPVTSGTASVAIHLPNGAPPATQSPGSRKTPYVAAGDATFDAVFPTASTLANGYFVAAVEAWSRRASGVVAAVGDSIVAGGGSTGENNKWSDRLAVRLDALPGHQAKSVLGLGIGGNRMLSGAITNPAALARFDRDVLGMAD